MTRGLRIGDVDLGFYKYNEFVSDHAQWVISVHFFTRTGNQMGYIGAQGSTVLPTAKVEHIDAGMEICGIHGVLSSKGNVVGFGFIVWRPPTH